MHHRLILFKNWRPGCPKVLNSNQEMEEMILVQSKLFHNPFAAKGIVNLAEVLPQPEPRDSSHLINPLLTYQKRNEELGKCMALYVKEGHLEGKSKEITTLVAKI